MMNRFCLVVWFVFWGMCVSPLTADDTVGGTADNTADNAAPASIVAIDVGIAGLYKNGCWTPIAVDTRNAGHEHRFRIETVDGDGVPTVYEFPGRKGSGAVRNVFYIKPGRATAPLGIKLLDVSGAILDSHLIAPKGAFGKTKRPVPAPYLTAGVPTGTRSRSAEVSVRFTEPVPMARPIYLVVGNENIGLQDAVAGLHLSENRRPVLAGLAPDAVWPDRSLGYEAIDMVVLTTREPFGKDGFPDEKGRAGNKRDASGRDEDRRNDANHPAMRALETWMLHGGHVFLVAGKDAEHYLQADRAFAAFLPGTFENMTDVRQGEILQLFAGSRRPLIMSGSEETPFLRTPYFRKQADGSVLLNDGDLPLAMRCAKGFGRLTYFGGDLAADPLLSWRDRHLLLSTILAWKNEQAIPGSNRPVIMMHYGYGDLAGQLRSSLEQFEGTRAVSFSLILIVMAGYVVAVGGLDWLLVHKFLGRPALTWLTFPLWVALFGMIAYGLGVGNRLDTAVVNQVDLLDIDVPGGHVRQSRWFSLYSPADARYDLTVRPSSSFSAFGADSPDSPDFHGSGTVDLLTWNGLSGSGLGGMAPQAYAPGVWQEGYGIDVGARDAAAENGLTHDRTRGVTGGAISTPGLRGLPVAVRSTKSLFMQTFSRTSMKDSRAAARRTGSRIVYRSRRLFARNRAFPSANFTTRWMCRCKKYVWRSAAGRSTSGGSKPGQRSGSGREIRDTRCGTFFMKKWRTARAECATSLRTARIRKIPFTFYEP